MTGSFTSLVFQTSCQKCWGFWSLDLTRVVHPGHSTMFVARSVRERSNLVTLHPHRSHHLSWSCYEKQRCHVSSLLALLNSIYFPLLYTAIEWWPITSNMSVPFSLLATPQCSYMRLAFTSINTTHVPWLSQSEQWPWDHISVTTAVFQRSIQVLKLN